MDLTKPQIVVRYSWRGPTKSGKPRVVPLMTPAVIALEGWHTATPHRNADDKVFCTATGLPRPKKDTGGWADRVGYKGDPKRQGIKTRSGITRAITFYSATRHTCASHLLMGSYGVQWSLSEIAAMLGHSDTDVTQRYAKVLGTHLHAKVAVASAAIQDQKDQKLSGPKRSNQGVQASPPENDSHSKFGEIMTKSGLPESNRRQPAWEAGTLPTELSPRE